MAPAPAPVEPEPEEELEDREAAIERLAEERAKKAAEFRAVRRPKRCTG